MATIAETDKDININPHFLEEFKIMNDLQVYVALVIALIPGILAIRLSTELYK